MDCGWWDAVGAVCSTVERDIVAAAFERDHSVPSCLSGAFSELQLKLSTCSDQRVQETLLYNIYGDVSDKGRDIIQTTSPLVTHIAHSAETMQTKRRNRLDILFGDYLPHNALSGQGTNVNNRLELSAATDDIADFVHLFRCVQNLCTVYTQYVSIATTSSDVDNKTAENDPSNDPTNDVLTFDDQPAAVTHKSESEVDKSNRDTSTAYLRPFTTPFIDSVNNIIEIMSKLISTSVIPALEVSPVPYTVSTKEWVCVLNSAYAAREAFNGLLNPVNSLSEIPRSHNSSDALAANINNLTQVFTQLDHALSETRDRAVLALCDVYDVMVVDNVNRQEWGSHNAYQRDKKVSHGTVYITTSIRGTVHDLMYHCGSTISCASEGNSNESNKDSGCNGYTDAVVYITLQLLLASLSIVTRAYFLLSPSRVRLFQWRIDLCHMLYCTLDSLSQLSRYKVVHVTRSHEQEQQNQNGLMDLDSLFIGDDEQFLINELYNIIQYLIISVSLVTQPAVENDTMVDSLRGILLNSVNSTERASEGRTAADADAVNGRDSDCYFATLTSLLSQFKSLNPLLSSVVDRVVSAETLLTPVNSPRYDMTADTNAYCGFIYSTGGEELSISKGSRPSGGDTTVDVKQLIHCVSDAERELYDKEANLKRDNQWAGARGVVFQRIVTMMTGCDSTALLKELVASSPRRLRAFLDLHQQLCYVEPSMSERVKDTSAIAAEKKLGRYFSVMLSRRFEVIESEYPKLTEEQIENASRIVLFINDFADP